MPLSNSPKQQKLSVSNEVRHRFSTPPSDLSWPISPSGRIHRAAAHSLLAPDGRPASRHTRQRSLSTSEIPDGVKRQMMRMKAEEELRTTEETYVRDLEYLKKVRASPLRCNGITEFPFLASDGSPRSPRDSYKERATNHVFKPAADIGFASASAGGPQEDRPALGSVP